MSSAVEAIVLSLAFYGLRVSAPRSAAPGSAARPPPSADWSHRTWAGVA